jgi:hypothetical protein|tara:strand:+ start:3891 stop:4403 length:513 start_codon:yes stop_codon:yes gene_type:complete
MLTMDDLPVEAVVLPQVYKARHYQSLEGEQLCLSVDGVVPSASTTAPQAKKCSVCFQNTWGSRITPNGKRGKACAESIKLTLRKPNSDYAETLRVPAASVRAFREYENHVESRGEKVINVVTKAHVVNRDQRPTLAFKVVRFLSADELTTIKQPSQQSDSPFVEHDGYTY